MMQSLLKKLAVPSFDGYALVAAIFISISSVIGYAFETADSMGPIMRDTSTMILALVACLAITLISYVVLAYLFRWFAQKAQRPLYTSLDMKAAIKRYFPIYLGIICICWLPWVISHYPGLIRDDAIRQLFQVYAIEPYSNGNPLFDTWVFGLFWQLGDLLGNRAVGLYIFGITQSLLTAASFAFMLTYMRRIGAPRAIVGLSLAAICLLSIFPLAAISMSKDSLNGWLFILFAVLFVEMCRSKGTILKNPWFITAFATITILAIATKKTMLYVVLLAFLAFFLFNKRFRIRSALTFAPIVIVAVLLCDVFMPTIMQNGALEKEPTSPPSSPTTFILIPLQQTGRLLASGAEIPQEQFDQLERYINCEQTAKIYNPRRADEVVWATKDGTTDADRSAYLSAWVTLGIENPGVYTSALINQTFGWFCPFWKIAYGTDLSNDVFDEGHMELWKKYFPGGVEDAQNFLAPLDTDAPALNAIQNFTDSIARLEHNTPLITSFGLWCTWIPFIGFCFALRQRNRRALIAFAIPAATLLSVLIGPMVLYWYAIPLYYIAPLIFVLGFLRDDYHPAA